MAQCIVQCLNASYYNLEDPLKWPRIQPNFDISGLGVILSFMATAYFTVVLIVLQYFLVYFEAPYLNAIDRGLLTYVRRKLRLKHSDVWPPTIRKGVMMISDQQLITGIAILAGAYSQLCGKISAYHWQIIVYLAWFSSLTHLTTLTIVRQYFREHPTIRAWRVSLMLIVVLLLGVALLPTGRGNWVYDDKYHINNYGYHSRFAGEFPALCAFRDLRPDKYRSDTASTMAMSLFVLFTSYTSRIVKLFPHTDALAQKWLRTKPGGIIRRVLDRLGKRADLEGATRVWRLAHLLLLSVYLVFRATFDIFGSMLWEIIWLILALAWGTSHLLLARARDHQNKSDWGFGQWVPLLMLALPLLNLSHQWSETKTNVSFRQDRHPTTNLPSQGNDSFTWLNGLVGQSSNDDDSSPDTLQMSTANIGSHTMSHNIDFYRFEWFHLLIAQIMFCFVAFSTVLLGFQDIMSALQLVFVYGGAYGAIFVAIGSIWGFSLVFLLLQQYRQHFGTVFEKYLHVPIRWHRTIHRTFLRGWVFGFVALCLAAVAISILLVEPYL